VSERISPADRSRIRTAIRGAIGDRTIDVIVNKVFRSIDAVELEDGGTMIDVVNRAEKRGIVESADRVRDLKGLRNDIVHEYETDDLRSLFRQTLDAVPEVFALAEKTSTCCARFDLPSLTT
jgi:uncharacterized protein YutE (UPF0331/DUF86 family)